MFRRSVTLIVFILSACQSATSTATSPYLTPTSPPPQTPIPQPTFTGTPSHTPTVPPSTVELEGAEVPEGFSLIKFADLYHPIAFTFDAQGRMYVTSQDSNVYILPDEDKDGRADSHLTFATGFYFPLGVTFHDPTGDIPFGIHQNDNLKFGPDGWLYIGVGLACKSCYDTDPRSALILRFNVDTTQGEINAKGLRNPFDLAFHPDTGDLFATDNGRDDLGMDAPFEELNHIIQGGDYGYPDCWNKQDNPGCDKTIPAVAFFEAHSSPMDSTFTTAKNFLKSTAAMPLSQFLVLG